MGVEYNNRKKIGYQHIADKSHDNRVDEKTASFDTSFSKKYLNNEVDNPNEAVESKYCIKGNNSEKTPNSLILIEFPKKGNKTKKIALDSTSPTK